MTREEIIRNLKYTMEKHKNDTVNTFGTNISVMCKDILDYLEQEPCDKCVYSTKDGCCQYDDISETIPPFEPCDCISRAELIDKTIKRNSIWLKITDSRGMNLQEIIDEIPSIQPTAKENLVVEDCISREFIEIIR